MALPVRPPPGPAGMRAWPAAAAAPKAVNGLVAAELCRAPAVRAAAPVAASAAAARRDLAPREPPAARPVPRPSQPRTPLAPAPVRVRTRAVAAFARATSGRACELTRAVALRHPARKASG